MVLSTTTEEEPDELSRSLILTRALSETDESFLFNYQRHLFVLTYAGKPVYSRHGSDNQLVTLMGLIQALVSFAESMNDQLQFIVCHNHHIGLIAPEAKANFRPLILCMVVQGSRSAEQIRSELSIFYNQFLFTILSQTRLLPLQDKPGFDLRSGLNELDIKLFNCFVEKCDRDPSVLLQSYRCFPLPEPQREHVRNTLYQCCRSSSADQPSAMIFALLLCQDMLVACASFSESYPTINPIDYLCLVNFIQCCESLRSSETNTPLCLPNINPDAIVYAYIKFIEVEHDICLILISGNS